MWERWNGWFQGASGGYAPPFSSFNQTWNCSVGEWLFCTVGGIYLAGASPGYGNVLIWPQPGEGVTNGAASLLSVRGLITSSWNYDHSSRQYNLNVGVPANSTATVFLPTTNNLAAITENYVSAGLEAASAPGVQSCFTTNAANWGTMDATVFQVGSGTYNFTVTNVSFW